MFFYTYDILYEVDEDGNDIYYSDVMAKKIAYDTTAYKRRDAAGKELKDEKGDVIYETADGKIAYDKKSGTRSPIYDSNGQVVIRDFTQEELVAVNDHATLLMEELEGQEKNYTLFDSYVEKYSEDEGKNKYTNGIYLTAETNYDAPEVRSAVFEMKTGEIRKIHSDYGIHIVMKYELDKNGYAKTDNSDFFVNADSGNFVFINELMTFLLNQRLAESISKVEVHNDRYDSISFKNIEPNFYY